MRAGAGRFSPLQNIVIQWLIQTSDAHPALARGLSPEGLLTDKETAVFTNLNVEKRRKDWLLGRWTAKKLLQQVHFQMSAEWLPFKSFEILAGKDGAPRVTLAPTNQAPDLHYSISISHSNHTALCAVIAGENFPIGADLEWIESRPLTFAENYFTENEQKFLQQIPPEQNDFWVTAIWSAKEAAFKAVREGLRLDTRQIECRFEDDRQAAAEWIPFSMTWGQDVADRYPQLQGWLKTKADYLLTLAVKKDQEIDKNA